MRKRRVFGSLWLAAGLAGAAGAAVELVRAGRPMADIVVATNALSSVALAARDLRDHLESMSGARLEIVHAPAEGFPNHVFVDPSAYVGRLGVAIDDLKPEGFKIVAGDRWLVLIGRDGSNLLVGAVCHESRMDALKTRAAAPDDAALFEDDTIEVYLETPERSYFRVAVNPNGALWDESQDGTVVARDTLPHLWNPGTQAAVRKLADRWTVELLIPIADFGTLGPSRDFAWGIQVVRTRRAGGEPEVHVLAPDGAANGPNRTAWGNLTLK